MKLTRERLCELLRYEPESGLFIRLTRPCGTVQIGDVAGSINKDGYVRILIDGRGYMAHRLAWLYVNGTWPENEIDHVNGVRSDNRVINLRDLHHSQNQTNQRKPSKRSKTGLLGVFKHGNKYVASISFKGKSKYLGLFETAEQAHSAYVTAKRSLHPASTI